MPSESKNLSSVKDARRASCVLGKVGKYIRRSIKSISMLSNDDKFISERKLHLIFATFRCSCVRPSTLSPTSPVQPHPHPTTPPHHDQPNECTTDKPIIPHEHASYECVLHEHSLQIVESENSEYGCSLPISTSEFSNNQRIPSTSSSDSNFTLCSPEVVPTVESYETFDVSEESKKRWGYVKPNNYLSPYMIYARYSSRDSNLEVIPFTSTPLSLVLLRYRKRQSRRRHGFVAPRMGIPKDLPAFEDSFLPYLN